MQNIFKDMLARLDRLSKRVTALETYEYIKLYPILTPTDYLIHANLTDGVAYDSGNLRGVQGVSEQAKGFFGVMWITPLIATVDILIAPGNTTPGIYSQQYKWATGGIANYFN